MSEWHDAITDIKGIRIGHASDFEYYTGCTVILCEEGAVGGVDIRGPATGTRQIDSLNPLHFVDNIHAVLLSGGSAFGLDATGGVMQYLREHNKGASIGFTSVPSVPTAVLFDLAFWDYRRHPDKDMGYEACLNATSGPVQQGSVGVGTGATVGKLFGVFQAMKGGVGTASMELSSGVRVGALAAVNAFGDVYDPGTGKILAGVRTGVKEYELANAAQLIKDGYNYPLRPQENTTLVVVVTDAKFDKLQTTRLAQMAQNGLVKTVRPVHSPFDGDIVFALSYGSKSGDLVAAGLCAEELVSISIQRAVKNADGFGLIPDYSGLPRETKPGSL